MYLPERDMLSVGLYVADAETGHVIRKLVNTASDPPFSSLLMVQVGLSQVGLSQVGLDSRAARGLVSRNTFLSNSTRTGGELSMCPSSGPLRACLTGER